MKTITINSSRNQVKETLKYMRFFQEKYKADPDWVELARKVVRQVGAHGPEAETEAVRSWIKLYVEYRMDPYGTEYLQDPMLLVETMCGDCDDMACMAGVLLSCIGHKCYPMGVVWLGEKVPTHAVCMDETSNMVCDAVSDCHASLWPGPGWEVERFVSVGS